MCACVSTPNIITLLPYLFCMYSIPVYKKEPTEQQYYLLCIWGSSLYEEQRTEFESGRLSLMMLYLSIACSGAGERAAYFFFRTICESLKFRLIGQLSLRGGNRNLGAFFTRSLHFHCSAATAIVMFSRAQSSTVYTTP